MTTERNIIEALVFACSQDPAVLKLGEEYLREWESRPGFYTTLAKVLADRSVDVPVRWMAITYIKNGVDRYWRPGAPHAVNEEEKAFVRRTLLESVEEPVQQISAQLVVLISRIARTDCPEKWPELLPFLAQSVCSTSILMQRCSLACLKDVIKALAARRLANYRTMFFELTGSLFTYLLQLWTHHLQNAIVQTSTEAVMESLKMASDAQKILQQMAVHGFPRFNASPEAVTFVENLFQRIPAFIQLRKQLSESHPAIPLVEKMTALMMKALQELQSHHPIGYVSYITPTLELIYLHVFSYDRPSERFVIHSMNLLRQILHCEDYQPPSSTHVVNVAVPSQVTEAHRAKTNFFNADVCRQMCQKFVGHFLLLTKEEMLALEEDSEEFVKEKGGESYTFVLRECIESTFLTMFHEYPQNISPTILAMVQAVQGTGPDADLQAILLKEAVYKAVGLAAYELYDEVDFDSWYSTHLLQELKISDKRYTMVRYRVVWMVGNWVGVKMSADLRPSLYTVLVSALQRTESLVVRLGAVEALQLSVDDFAFTSEVFSPFVASVVELLLQLLTDVDQGDTKMKVLNVLSLIIERMGSSIRPHIGTLLQFMPQLWEESSHEGSSMLRCVILVALTNIVKAVEGDSLQLQPMTSRAVALATDAKRSEHVYLAEDGLDLWLAMLYHTPSVSDVLLHLLNNMVGLLGLQPPCDDESSTSMVGLMDIGNDGLEVCFKILEAYTVLCASQPSLFMQHCSEVVIKACRCYLCDVKPQCVMTILNVVEKAVLIYPQYLQQLMTPLLPTILKCLLDEDYQTTSPAFYAVISRVLLTDPRFFVSFVQQLNSMSEYQGVELFGLILDHWADRLDAVALVQQKKLTGFAASTLLALPEISVVGRFATLVNMCVEVLHDVVETDDDNGTLYDVLVGTGEPKEKTLHHLREYQVAQCDVVFTTSLHTYIASKLEECRFLHGPGYGQLIETIDPSVREQLVQFVSVGLLNVTK